MSFIPEPDLYSLIVKSNLREAQEIAELVTRSEVRVGEMLAEIPKATRGTGSNQYVNAEKGTDTHFSKPKNEVVRDLGFTEMQAKRIQKMAAHPEIVEQATAEAHDIARVSRFSTPLTSHNGSYKDDQMQTKYKKK